MKKYLIVLFILLLALPTSVLAFYKPSRVIVPQWFGVSCVSQEICIDDLTRLDEAKELRREAIEFVNSKVDKIENPPRIIFCSTLECSDKFGMFHAAAYNVATFGIVIRVKGWENYFVRHELIHHLQNERLGSVNAFFNKPTWFIEGMAYSLSEDPRRPIPNVTLENYRQRFEEWVTPEDLWTRAKEL